MPSRHRSQDDWCLHFLLVIWIFIQVLFHRKLGVIDFVKNLQHVFIFYNLEIINNGLSSEKYLDILMFLADEARVIACVLRPFSVILPILGEVSFKLPHELHPPIIHNFWVSNLPAENKVLMKEINLFRSNLIVLNWLPLLLLELSQQLIINHLGMVGQPLVIIHLIC